MIVWLLCKYRLTYDIPNRNSNGVIKVLDVNTYTKSRMQGKKQSQRKTSKPKPAKQKQASLGRSLLKAGLGGLGGLLGPAGATVGASLGDWGANILGMGDYEVKNNPC